MSLKYLWSCRDDNTEALAGIYEEVYNTLTDISEDIDESPNTRHAAYSTRKILIKL